MVLLLVIAASSGVARAADRIKVKVGIVGESGQEIWKPVVEKVKAEGIDIELVSFSDYVLPNSALDAGEIDLNAFQHHLYLNNEVKTKGYKITSVGDTFLSAMSVYSSKIKSVKELKEGDRIALPNDLINLGRALTVLQGAGVIKLEPAAGLTPDVTDIVENPLKLDIFPVEAPQVPSILPDVAAGVINGNYAVDFGLSPRNDAIFYDDLTFYKDDSYVNIIAVKIENAEKDYVKKIVKAYQSDEVKKVFEDYFDGSYLPAWK
jgi:D-methionine transport system substrate-binding protein